MINFGDKDPFVTSNFDDKSHFPTSGKTSLYMNKLKL